MEIAKPRWDFKDLIKKKRKEKKFSKIAHSFFNADYILK